MLYYPSKVQFYFVGQAMALVSSTTFLYPHFIIWYLSLTKLPNMYTILEYRLRLKHWGKPVLPKIQSTTVANWLFCYQVNIHPISWISVFFSLIINYGKKQTNKQTKNQQQLGGKQLDCRLPHEVDIDIDCSLGHLHLCNWWKKCSWTLKRLTNSMNWQEIEKFEEKSMDEK